VELPKLSLDKFTDSYFKAAEDKQKKKKGEDEFFKTGAARQIGRINTSYLRFAAAGCPAQLGRLVRYDR
jgi:hypothetical protein